MGLDDAPMHFQAKGWLKFASDPAVLDWVAHALPVARAAVADPALAHWHVCEGTWFVGVDALPNDALGRIGGSGPLRGAAIAFIEGHVAAVTPLHRGQLSVVYPGYPRPRAGESNSAFRYRGERDAAHVDGLRAHGPDRRRRIDEPHAFILGLPLNVASQNAAPLVVWEGSHRLMRAAFAEALRGHDPADWHRVDVTDAYVAARRKVFQTCPRVPVPAQPGEAVLLDRLALHGVAPWRDGAQAGADGRMIAYYRPEMAQGGVQAWIGADGAEAVIQR